MSKPEDLAPVPLVRVMLLTFIKLHPRSSGYDLAGLIRDFTRGGVELKSGTIYGELRRLEYDRLVTSNQEATGRRKRTYVISEAGIEELSTLVSQVKSRIEYILQPLVSLSESVLEE